jgi:hypothetical protein
VLYRRCVVALEYLAGDRQYASLLPRQYVQLWKDVGEVGREGSERESLCAAAFASRGAVVPFL